jgi:Tfp pilus assembly protein FimT
MTAPTTPACRRPDCGLGAKGFSLIDLLLVVLILGIVGVVVTPQYHAMMAETKLNAATSELVAALHYAQNLAVRYQKPFCIRANAANDDFCVFDAQYATDSSPHYDFDLPLDTKGVVFHPLDKKRYEISFDETSSFQDVDLDFSPMAGTTCFWPDGHSSLNNNTFFLSYQNHKKSVTVNGTTGQISVQ